MALTEAVMPGTATGSTTFLKHVVGMYAPALSKPSRTKPSFSKARTDAALSAPTKGEARPRYGYSSNTNLSVKVLDFVKLGGPARTELRTFRWEVLI